MKTATALVALLAMMSAATSVGADDAAIKEYLGMGHLRVMHVGVVVGPTLGPGKVVRDASGDYHGVEADLARELAQKLGVKVELMAHSSSELLARSGQVGEWALAFAPVDEALSEYIAHGSPYVELQATYLVKPGSRIRRIADVDKPGVRVAGIARSAVTRAAERLLKKATVTKIALEGGTTTDQVLQLMEPLTSGQADVLALSREEAAALSARLPGSRVLDGAFWKSHVAIALPGNPKIVVAKGDGGDPSRAAVLAYLSAFIDNAIRAGTVREALNKHGMKSAKVPPPGTRP
jgi:polar amino acid transport system substrate-binding protein